MHLAHHIARSVLSRSIQASWWPTIFQADSASTRHVDKKVTFLSWLVTLSLLLLGIAGVITPLGLSEAVRLGGSVTPSFHYVADSSPFGYGTPPRYTRFSRVCGNAQGTNCPGRFDGVVTTYDNTSGGE